jgi:hypothetical protein
MVVDVGSEVVVLPRPCGAPQVLLFRTFDPSISKELKICSPCHPYKPPQGTQPLLLSTVIFFLSSVRRQTQTSYHPMRTIFQISVSELREEYLQLGSEVNGIKLQFHQ